MRRQCIGTCKKYICSSSATFNSYTSSGLRSWIFRYESVGPKSEPFKPECFHVSQPNAKPGPESNAHLTVSQQVHTRILAISLLWMYNWNAHSQILQDLSHRFSDLWIKHYQNRKGQMKTPVRGFYSPSRNPNQKKHHIAKGTAETGVSIKDFKDRLEGSYYNSLNSPNLPLQNQVVHAW